MRRHACLSNGSIYDVYYNRASKGGHFTAWEEPELFDGEIRAAFKVMR